MPSLKDQPVQSISTHPSEKTIVKLANVLGLDSRELFFLANPQTKALVSQKTSAAKGNAWDQFSKDKNLLKHLNIIDEEMEILWHVAQMGSVRSPRDFVFILNSIRNALGT